MEKLNVGSDYSGVGAFDQALIRLGVPFKKLFACDFDYNARLTYILNFGTEKDLEIAKSKEHKMFCDGMEFLILGYSEQKQIDSFERWCKKLSIDGRDLETIKWNFAIAADEFASTFSFYYPFNVYDREIPEDPLDIYMTSPPCQAFSLAGKRLGKSDIKGILFFNSLEFIDKNRPKFFTFENVKGLLSDDKTNKKAQYGNTFQEWINYLGGKSVNGNPTFFPYEDSVPYHIYFKVLNAKDYGVPQNRERIFIIGIRDDEDNNFSFPMPFPLEKRLKDILEAVVDEKYFLSDKMVEDITFGKKPNGEIANLNKGGERGSVYDENCDVMSCLAATDYKQPKQILTEIIQLNDPVHSNDRVYSELGISPTLNTMQGGNRQPFVQVSEPILLNKTKYDKFEVNESAITQTIISGGTAPKDKIPCVVIQLNESKESGVKQPYQQNRVYSIEGIMTSLDTESGRKSILVEANTKKGFEKAEEEEDSINFSNPNSKTRRGRVGKKVAQTLDTACNQGVFTQQRIRRLTPTECFRLMDFNPEMIEKTISSGLISDSQLYKQAGNSICVEPLKLLMQKILKL